MKLKREHLLLYGITSSEGMTAREFDRAVGEALRGGMTCLQLREKHMTEQALISEAKRIGEITRAYGVPLIINDNFRAAAESGADGVHVGSEDMPVDEIRAMVGDNFIIGATAKTPAQALAAAKSGADYLGVGAVFPSPTKTTAIRITSAQLREICGSVQIPAVAIGGITAENLHEIGGCGAAGIAVVSALFGAEDIRKAAEILRQRCEEFVTAAD